MALRSKEKFCPHCEANISDTYEPADPEAGMPNGEWWCEECQMAVYDDDA
jgi:hypothetical protein